MGLEDLTGGSKYISDLTETNPTATDNKSQGDDHIRGLKNVIKNTLPNVTGAVTATQADINQLTGAEMLRSDADDTATGSITFTNIKTHFSHTSASLYFDSVLSGDGYATKRLTCNDGGHNFGFRTGHHFTSPNDIYSVTGDGATKISMAHESANGWVQIYAAQTGTSGNVITWDTSLRIDSATGITCNGDFDIPNTYNLKIANVSVTSSAAELNILDGCTATTAELNYNDVTTLGTVQASKTVTADASRNITNINSLTATSLTKGSTPVYGLVILDTPESLVNSTTTGAWQTVNSTTLNTASATKAILRVRNYATIGSATSLTGSTFIRKTGSGLSTSVTKVLGIRDFPASSANLEAEGITEITVNLDSNSDFDWYSTGTGTGTGLNVLTDIRLVGYYV